MNKLLKFLIVVGLAVVVLNPAQPASAGMISDTITINRLYPDLDTLFPFPPPGTVSTIVAAGSGDAVSPQPQHYLIDLEANNIYFDFLNSSAFVGVAGGVFDGLEFLGFSQAIQNVTVVNATGISVAELLFGTNFIHLNLNGSFTDASSLNLSVEFVPEPSTLALIGAGLAAFAASRRRRRSKA